jgi:hypothetical protein
LPAAPEAKTARVSEVDVSLSTVMALKVVRTAAVSARCSASGATAASVVITPIIVAIDGAIMPAPLTMPATVTALPPMRVCTTADLGRVSVVMIARRTAASSSRPSRLTAAAMPARTFSIGRRWPMMPVEATSTSSGRVPSSLAVWRAMAWASLKPPGPVQTFAQPALIVNARAVP